ncbi:alkaline phosphatase [Staphylococcus arlettae]|uniref:Alkaline phosphatase n=5 Tax=Staphylococcus arlettae TaxID=29378 RepID=A0A2T7BT45_9STAP|nr:MULTISPECIES: alkaline phosphatase [Staphylococcus]ERF47968.1 alkaline phosphatase [Staphylococcus sp. EGD-HP3]KAB2479179.1 alkaline phosphatase [Staphylococcus sp. CH99b_3]MCD8815532.1 alkaline phosphatase [Staphylococcus arlettae]MCD8834235.1 alkaline phosphatase [Staphylococcus arlettae]MCD8839124.1 alkaline phosphatase [Staphylococcus arlettae]
MNMWKKIATLSLATSIAASSIGTSSISQASSKESAKNKDEVSYVGNTKNPKNVIFLVGDGMGPSYNAAYRYFADDPNTKEMDKTAFDEHLVGTQRTNPNDPKENVTDSAAGATAFSSGHKTFNGAIGVDANKQKVKTVLEQAKENGKSTGLVSTAEITDATPAAYASHVDDRDKKDEIAQQFYNDKINGEHKVDVLLGGGSEYFGKDNGDLTKKFKKDGYDIVKNKNDLKNSKGDQVLGLFAKNDMPLNIDAPNKNPELVDMEKSALDRLSKNDKGFFLMVEGASIDKAGHPNDVTGVMSEMGGFEKAFKHATEYAKSNPDTLVVATADHSTGGMSIAKGEDYEWNPDAIHSMKHSGKYMTEQIADGKNPEKVINEGYGFDISKDNMSDIKEEAENMKGLKEDDSEYEDQLQKLQDAIQKPINDKSNTGWTTYGHTGEDVNTYAMGQGSEKFKGNIDNTDNAKNIFEFFQQ